MAVKKAKIKIVTITDKHSLGEDEAYGEWIAYPNCDKCTIAIACDFSYCPGCGRKIRWKIKDD